LANYQLNKMKKIIFTLVFTIIVIKSALAQCNTPSDGQNLVVNGDFSQGSTSFTSGYTQHCLSCVSGTGGCVNRDAYNIGYSNAGEYCVTDNIYQNFHCCLPNFNGSITNTFTDHSPSGDNLAMLVDGNSTLGVDLWCQTVTVQPSTNYYFTAYIATLFYDGDANKLGKIRFQINGVSVGATIVSPTTLGTWTAYTYVWASGATSGPISICITNDNTAATGNDFVIDDIAFTAGCAFGAPGPQPLLNGGAASVTLCGNPGGVTLTSGVTGTALEFIWKKDGVVIPAATTATYNATLPGVYEVCTRETVPPSCYRSDVITVTNNYSVNLGTDATLCNPPSVTLNAGITGSGITYLWRRNGSIITGATSSTYLATSSGTYFVEVNDPLCGIRTDDIVLTSSLTATPNDAYFCAPPAKNVNLSVTGTGTFNWYSAPTGGSILSGGSNNSAFTTPLISSSTTYYVEDATLSNYIVGPDRADIGGGIGGNEDRRDNLYGSGGSGDFYLEFQTSKPNIVINSVVMYGYCNQWTPCNGNLRLSFYNTSNVLQYQSAPFAYSLTGGMGGSPITMLTVPVNVTLASAGTYRVSIDGSTTGNSAQWILKTNMAPVACNYTAYNIPGTFSFISSKPTWMTCPWTYFFKWSISAPGDCGRIPVQAISDCALPIHLFNFEASLKGNAVSLKWFSLQEKSVNYYIIEKSYDGIHFYPIATISTKENTSISEYTYLDPVDKIGTLYYRIIEHQINNNTFISEMKHVTPVEPISITVKPNPAKDAITITGNIEVNEVVSVKLVSVTGSVVFEQSELTSTNIYSKTINIENQANGMYYLYVYSSSQTHFTKIIKEKQ
jgi:hypothetical protein